MARKWKELTDAMDAKMAPEERTAYKLRLAKDIARVRLTMMRQQRKLSQAALAERLGTDQGSISRMEKQADMHLSTLRGYIEAAGGRLELHAVFPDQTMTLEVCE